MVDDYLAMRQTFYVGYCLN